MAGVFTVFTLHTRRIFQEVSTKSTAHNIIELLENELMSIQLVNFFFTLAYGTFTI